MAYRAHEYKSDDELQVSFLHEILQALSEAHEQLMNTKMTAPSGAATFFGGAAQMYKSAAETVAITSIVNLIKSVGEVPAGNGWVELAAQRLRAASLTGSSLDYFNGKRHVEEALEILQEMHVRLEDDEEDDEEDEEEEEDDLRVELDELRLELAELRDARRLD